MIRIIVSEADARMAANVGGPVKVTYKTFDISAPVIEAWLKASTETYIERQFVGLEVLDA